MGTKKIQGRRGGGGGGGARGRDTLLGSSGFDPLLT